MNKIEEKYGLKPSQAIALLVILALNVLWFACSILSRIELSIGLTVDQIANIVMFAVTVYYVCYSYKKPHGNLMRYLILCSAVFSAVKGITFNYPTYISSTCFLMVILKSYMAGRLDHYKQNVIISAVILICQCIMSYYIIDVFTSFEIPLTFNLIMSVIGPVTLWLAIATSYIIRYKPHKEAGLEK